MGITDKLKRSLNGQEEEDDGILADVSSATTLSWSTRIKGFAVCFVLGIICSLLGSFLLFISPTAFAVLYSLGTVTSLASTMFLMGPCKQLKKMVDPTRIICVLVLLVSIVLTVLSAVVWDIIPLAIVFCIIQFLALAWYSISYIPFASREAICGTLCDLYQRSTILFISGVVALTFILNSVFIHYAPLLSTVIQLIALYMQGTLLSRWPNRAALELTHSFP